MLPYWALEPFRNTSRSACWARSYSRSSPALPSRPFIRPPCVVADRADARRELDPRQVDVAQQLQVREDRDVGQRPGVVVVPLVHEVRSSCRPPAATARPPGPSCCSSVAQRHQRELVLVRDRDGRRELARREAERRLQPAGRDRAGRRHQAARRRSPGRCWPSCPCRGPWRSACPPRRRARPASTSPRPAPGRNPPCQGGSGASVKQPLDHSMIVTRSTGKKPGSGTYRICPCVLL